MAQRQRQRALRTLPLRKVFSGGGILPARIGGHSRTGGCGRRRPFGHLASAAHGLDFLVFVSARRELKGRREVGVGGKELLNPCRLAECRRLVDIQLLSSRQLDGGGPVAAVERVEDGAHALHALRRLRGRRL